MEVQTAVSPLLLSIQYTQQYLLAKKACAIDLVGLLLRMPSLFTLCLFVHALLYLKVHTSHL